MKRVLGAFLIGVVLLFGASGVVAHPAAATVNDFRISKFAIQYELSQDSNGRSVLRTTETITAEFPQADQNHGIERAIPTTYNERPVDVTIQEAANLNGDTSHSVTRTADTTLLRIGSASRYVHGTQTYRIVYTQRDVTRFYQDTGKDEWYWDTNGTQWRVPIDVLTVSMNIAPEAAQKLSGPPSCYYGAQGATSTCSISRLADGTYTLEQTNLAPGQNVTVAFGFEKGTFSPYRLSAWSMVLTIWGIFQVASLLLMFLILIGLGVLFSRIRNRTREVEPIVVEYIPPRDVSVTTAAQLLGNTRGSTFTAQLIDLAVRHYIVIIETRPKSTWRSARYDIEVTTDLGSLLDEEKELMSDIFGHEPKVGERIALKTLVNNREYYKRTLDNTTKTTGLIETTYVLREKSPERAKPFRRWATALTIVGVLTVSLPILIGAGVVWLMSIVLRPLSDKGLALRRYLLGFDRYVKASEKERLAFLQGPDTVQKVGYAVATDNPGEMLKLYERALPYAILFGYDKEWATYLGNLYETTGTQPGWYGGTGTFNALTFSAAMSSFSTASSYSGGASSGSGGSGGGGFSGGGGGGGGGGGW